MACPAAFSVAVAICTGVPFASSSILTAPAGTPLALVTVTFNVVSVTVSPDVGQVCVLDCAVSVVDVVAWPKRYGANNSADAIANPATQ